jgi:hypothetical protein
VHTWHIITGEYPPQIGGVSDYSQLVAEGLAAEGNTVHVWTTECSSGLLYPGPRRTSTAVNGAEIHRLPGRFGPGALTTLARALRAAPEQSVLVQYVPHAYGYRAMNLPFCLWLNSMRHVGLTVMFHEVAFPLSWAQPLKHNVLGAVTRFMAQLVCHSATRILVASARWETLLRRIGGSAPISWVPVPSNIPVSGNSAATARWRRQCTGGEGLLLGHFASHSDYSVERLTQIIPSILSSHPSLGCLLIGANSNDCRGRLLDAHPQLAQRVHATGTLESQDVSSAMAACDVMIQPYPDGVSTRRGSIMALLAHGRAVVTTDGVGTEPLWRESGAVEMAPVRDPGRMREALDQMISNHNLRNDRAHAGLKLYDDRFALRHTIAALTAI